MSRFHIAGSQDSKRNEKNGKSFEYKIYADAPHGFNSDTILGILPPRGGEGGLGQDIRVFQETSAELAERAMLLQGCVTLVRIDQNQQRD